MSKWLIGLVGVLFLIGGSSTMANEIATQMDIINKNYGAAMKTDSAAEFVLAMETMRSAALKAQQGTPDKLAKEDKNSANMQDFRLGLSTLISEIDGAKVLAEQGQLAQAKQAAEEFKKTRDANHKRFK